MGKFFRGAQGVTLGLIGLCVLLAGTIAIELVRGRRPVQDGTLVPAKVADVGLLPGFTLPPPDQGFPEMASRSLFVPTRRAAPPAAATQAHMPKGQFALLGTSVTKELGDIVMLKHLPTGKFHSVRKGEQINGITIDTVEAERVILRMGDETEEVTMKTSKATAPPPPPPGTAPLPATPNAVPPGPIPSPPPPGLPTMPSRAPQPAPVMPGAAPLPPSADASQQLTPEQIIARRRAARAQQTQ